MTDTPTGGSEHTVSQGDVDVHRAVEVDGTEVIATVELTSTADEPVLVEVTEELSDERSVESTGFKTGAAPDSTELADGLVRFEQAVADAPEVVVYGLRLSDPVETVEFTPPTIETVEPVAAGATDGHGGRADDADTADAAGADAAAVASTAVGRTAADEASGTDIDGTDEADDPSEALPTLSLSDADIDDESPAGAETRTSTMTTDGGDTQVRQSVDVRLDRLSAQVEEFAAYAESLGTLVDDHGTPAEFVDRFDERIGDVDDRLTSTRTEFHEELETVHDDVGSVDEELAALREDLDEVASSMERVREETATLREELGDIKGIHESLAATLGEWAAASDDGDE